MITSLLLGVFVLHLFQGILTCDFDLYRGWAQRRLALVGQTYSTPCIALSGGQNESQLLQNLSIKVFLFQNDERELLSDWLQYHTYLIGFNNLHVVDHASADTDLCKLLTMYSLCGTTLTSFHKDFGMKGELLTKLMRKEPNSILIPLDIDEFVTFTNNSVQHQHVSFDRDVILPKFMQLPLDGHKYKFKEVLPVTLDNVSCTASEHYEERVSGVYRRTMHAGYTGETIYKMSTSKSFFYSEGFIATDQGNHVGHAAIDDIQYPGSRPNTPRQMRNFVISNLSLLHVAQSTYESLMHKMVRGAQAYGYTVDTDCTHVGVGIHYCVQAKQFQQDPEGSRQAYRRSCHASKTDKQFSSMRDWFAVHAMSLEQIVGGAATGNATADGSTR